MLEYFQNLFTFKRVIIYHWDHIHITPISQVHKVVFEQPFNTAEIKKAISNLGTWKSLGPDGIPNGFYKENWDLIGEYIIQTVFNILSTQTSLYAFNQIDLVLIPKK